jgi:hypothetical protein
MEPAIAAGSGMSIDSRRPDFRGQWLSRLAVALA